MGGRRIARIPRETFAIIDVAFGPGSFCLSESGGPVCCFDTSNGKELWRSGRKRVVTFARLHTPRVAHTFPASDGLAQTVKSSKCFVLTLSRASARLAIIRNPKAEIFVSRGGTLITTDGEVIDLLTLKTENASGSHRREPSLNWKEPHRRLGMGAWSLTDAHAVGFPTGPRSDRTDRGN